MKPDNKKLLFSGMIKKLNSYDPADWSGISSSLEDIREDGPPLERFSRNEFLEKVRTRLAFWIFDFGIDGISIKISKYAQCLHDILSNERKAVISIISQVIFKLLPVPIVQPSFKSLLLDRAGLRKNIT